MYILWASNDMFPSEDMNTSIIFPYTLFLLILNKVLSSSISWNILYKISEFHRNWLGFPGGSAGKESACNARDLGVILGSGRSPIEGNGNPLQYSCLRNPMDRGTWQPTTEILMKPAGQIITQHLSCTWAEERQKPCAGHTVAIIVASCCKDGENPFMPSKQTSPAHLKEQL